MDTPSGMHQYQQGAGCDHCHHAAQEFKIIAGGGQLQRHMQHRRIRRHLAAIGVCDDTAILVTIVGELRYRSSRISIHSPRAGGDMEVWHDESK